MQPGTLFYIVGPSGVGKDTLISEAMRILEPTNRYVQARRVVTRPAGIGEDHEPVSIDEFERASDTGEFLHFWGAHDLRYGLRRSILDDLRAGRNVLANGSRQTLPKLDGIVERFVIVEITAPRALLRERLLQRGRETADQIAQRVARKVPPFPQGLDVVTIVNDTSVEEAVEALVGALEGMAARLKLKRMPISSPQRPIAFLAEDCALVNAATYAFAGRVDIRSFSRPPMPADIQLIEAGEGLARDEIGLTREAFEEFGLLPETLVSIDRTPSPQSRELLRRKIAGSALSSDEYATLFQDIVARRYPEGETAAFLLKAIQSLDDAETVAVATARCQFASRIDWGGSIVVDKHSLGGIPGSRITPIVVPIVAAAGLLMPKTSSRAITSASGTADVMEALCRIDLDGAAVQAVVQEAGGCIAWNGRLNHSVLDDVVNAFTRPLGLNSNQWSVASILSKKWSAGSTHVVVDLPFGPRAKLKTEAEASELGRLFELVGRGLGMTVRAFATDGSAAIGRGIGPALELRDVMAVLDNAPNAPSELREKALFYAAHILNFSPRFQDLAEARAEAIRILSSGEAKRKLEIIAKAQGDVAPVAPARLTRTVRSRVAGCVGTIDGWYVSGIARRAGAPLDKSAGVDLLVDPGDHVSAGDALYRIHASDIACLNDVAMRAAAETGVTITPRENSACSSSRRQEAS